MVAAHHSQMVTPTDNHNTTPSMQSLSLYPSQSHPPKNRSRRKELRFRKRAQKVKSTPLVNIINVTQKRTINTCLRTFGFIANPSKPLWNNVINAIETYDQKLLRSQPTNLAFHNLCSTKQPPPNMQQLLGLGLKFCIETPTPKPNLQKTVKNLVRSVRTQAYLTENNKTTNSTYIPQLYVKNPNWTPPLASGTIEHKLFEFAALLDEKIKNHSTKKRYNTTFQQYKSLRQLKNNPDFIILNTDKNLGPAIMNRHDYITRVLKEHLLTNAYQPLLKNHALIKMKQNKQNVRALLNENKGALSTAEVKYFRRSFKSHHQVPMFYAMPKVHKTPYTTRPIVSCIGSFNAILSTWLDFRMKQLIPFVPLYLPNSEALLAALETLPNLPQNAKIFTADAVSMYTNIDTQTGINAFEKWFSCYSHELPPDFPCQLFLQVLEFVMNQNIFQFDDTFWLQTQGTAMGTPAACMYATISYGFHERTDVLPKFANNNLVLYTSIH